MTNLHELNGTYTIDPAHSRIGFVARHAMVTKVRGSFDDFEGTATTGAGLDGAQVELTIQAESIDTRQSQRDSHLRTGDFLEVEKFPQLTFRSTRIEAKGAATLLVTGDLTIKGVTKPLTIEFDYNGEAKDHMGNMRIGFDGTAEILRSDFGMTFNAALETGGVLVSDKITLEFEISAVKQA